MRALERLDSITEVDRAEWDRIAGDDCFVSYGWLRTVEEASLPRHARAYFVARENGVACAIAPCCVLATSRGVSGLDRLLFGRAAPLVRRLGAGVSPVLVVGPTVGLGDHILVAKEQSPIARRRIAAGVLEAIEDTARSNGWGLCFRNVGEQLGSVAELLRKRGYVRASELPSSYLDVRWPSFHAYLRDLKTCHPSTVRSIRKEINRARRQGVSFRKLAGRELAEPRFHALLDAHYHRLNRQSFPFGETFLPTLIENLGDNVLGYGAFKGDEAIGVVVGFRSQQVTYLTFIGVDSRYSRDAAVYFNNGYTVPIEDAIGAGTRRLFCGKRVYEVKLRRGFRLLPLSVYLRFRQPLLGLALKPFEKWQAWRVRSTLPAVS